jgi:hypothetical protein
MIDSPIQSTFVSQVAPLGFADAIDAADRLVGQEISVGGTRLQVHARLGDGLAGAVWYSGTLRTGSGLIPSVRVDVVISPWSAGRIEVGLRPLSRIGRAESLRARRFFDAAWAVVPELAGELARVAETPVAAVLQVAA